MITIFNRRELAITFEMKKQAEIREMLSLHGIEYQIKTVNRTSPGFLPVGSGTRARTGTPGIKMEYTYTYKIYVKKSDYEKARAVISGRI